MAARGAFASEYRPIVIQAGSSWQSVLVLLAVVIGVLLGQGAVAPDARLAGITERVAALEIAMRGQASPETTTGQPLDIVPSGYCDRAPLIPLLEPLLPPRCAS